LREVVTSAGFEVERLFDFNRAGVPGWRVNGWMRRTSFSRVQLKLFDSTVWLARHLDRVLPWPGLSLIVIGRKPGEK
ncbi:MAG TPA: hypothetical protein VMT21_04290, partial [Gemmatimonadales bacterium]|nr:hypothetical protein [Gemmatimonadales bacterium]